MTELINLGNLYVSDFIKDPNDYEGREKSPLTLMLDERLNAPRLTEAVDPDQMYRRQYWYRSGTNESMRRSLQDIVTEIEGRVKFDKGDIWLDIACNDGTLLSFVDKKLKRIGIDPNATNGPEFVKDYFSAEVYNKASGGKKASVITTVAMLYDLAEPVPFVEDVYIVLKDDGIWVIQMSYTPLMMEQLAFDNICHEHVYYYGLLSIERLVGPLGFCVVDCSLNETNGGSFRVTLQKKSAPVSSFGSAPVRDVCNYRIGAFRSHELGHLRFVSVPQQWMLFSKRLERLKAQTVGFIRDEKSKGKTVYAYGASTKGNTLLQYYGLTADDITAIAERDESKYGLHTVGTNIPIIPESEVRKSNPDYMLVLPWHFIGNFCEREKDYLKGGGRFIVPCPRFEVISNG